MEIQLAPDDERMIRESVASGAFSSPVEFIRVAIDALREQSRFLVARQEAFDAELGRRVASLDRGDGIEEEQLRERLEGRKLEWLRQNRLG
jgi:Arc/MetJ-type ribon-helix-helix transcriptional regulator